MRIPRPIVVAALTAVTVGSISHAVLPGARDHHDPARVHNEQARQYSQNRRAELEELRRKSAREADAIAADKLRPAERRTAEKEAAAVVRGLLRKP